MSFLLNIWSFLTSDLLTTFITLIISFIFYKITKFYANVFTLPPGPIPLPLVGNILYFRGKKGHWAQELSKLPAKYGSVFTFWLGPKPFVFIADINSAKDTFRKKEFSGRPESFFGEMFSTKEHRDVVFSVGPTWEALRRVAHSAVQKYSTTDRLVLLTSSCAEKTMAELIANFGRNKPFVPFDSIYFMFINILANSAFGKGYTVDDPEYKLIKYVLKDIQEEAGTQTILWEVLPILRFFDRKLVAKTKLKIAESVDMITNNFKSHYNSYDESVVRDFCDALISAKNDALNEGKESAPYLTDANLSMVIFNLFFAGTDTSQQTFHWLLLFCLYYPEINEKLRQEIESQIGDRMPTHEDRNRCHYVTAFISETLRFRNVTPVGVFHSPVVTSKIGDYTIPKGNGVFVFQSHILNDEKNWSNPDQFNPDRFLKNGEFITTRPSAFIPFGVGRRVCLGEKLAIADLFFVFVRFFQMINEYGIELHSHNGIVPDPNISDAFVPKEYKLIITKNV